MKNVFHPAVSMFSLRVSMFTEGTCNMGRCEVEKGNRDMQRYMNDKTGESQNWEVKQFTYTVCMYLCI